jgi:folate-dependent tRNA-U54 methylase TrmFO/GidA
MVLFVGADGARGCSAQLPSRETAIGAGQLSGGEGFADQSADASLVGWFGSEKYSQRDGFSV